MGCRSDYLELTTRERELRRVRGFLDEVKPNVARLHYSDVDKMTAELCGLMGKMSKKKLGDQTLELQIWWRDHQAADAARDAKEKQKKDDSRDIKAALAKLTKREIDLIKRFA